MRLRKQRKYLANAPLHVTRKFLSVMLSKELKGKYGKRNVPVRKGDEVKVMRGQFKGRGGKVVKVYRRLRKVEVSGLQITKKDGGKVPYLVHPSNLKIVELAVDDVKRRKILERK